MSFGIGYAPFTPPRPERQTDRGWITEYQRRHKMASARRYNANAADHYTQLPNGGGRSARRSCAV